VAVVCVVVMVVVAVVLWCYGVVVLWCCVVVLLDVTCYITKTLGPSLLRDSIYTIPHETVRRPHGLSWKITLSLVA
jgi:hypothetical protein